MNIGDLVQVKNNPDHIGLVTCLDYENGYDWITIQWITGGESALMLTRIPMESAKHLEVIQ